MNALAEWENDSVPQVLNAAMTAAPLRPSSRLPCAGFTLIELLVVVAVMAVMTGLAIPAFESIKGGNDVTTTAYNIKGTLDQARAYAMTNNTYVFVGIQEFAASVDSSVVPQGAGTGRVAMAVVAARDGTPGSSTTNLMPIFKLQHFENTHLVDLSGAIPASGGMARPAPSPGGYVISDATVPQTTVFSWPIGAATAAQQYSFNQVINFDPEGAARIQSSGNGIVIPSYIEIGFEASHGTAITTSSNAVAIQIDGVTGATQMYRP